jgi:hypothetical protein
MTTFFYNKSMAWELFSADSIEALGFVCQVALLIAGLAEKGVPFGLVGV